LVADYAEATKGLMDGGADYVVTSMADLPLLIERLRKIDAENAMDKT